MIYVCVDENNKEMMEWANKEKSVKMPNGLWSALRSFLLMTTNYRKDEASAWARLAAEKDEDGSPVYPNAEKNSQFWFEMQAEMEMVLRRMDA